MKLKLLSFFFISGQCLRIIEEGDRCCFCHTYLKLETGHRSFIFLYIYIENSKLDLSLKESNLKLGAVFFLYHAVLYSEAFQYLQGISLN